MIHQVTYTQPFYPDSLTFNLAKESGEIYSKAMLLNRDERKDVKSIEKEMAQFCKQAKFLHSQSAQASYQSFITNLLAFFASLKAYKKNPTNFSGPPKPPYRSKFLFAVKFKKAAIHYKNNELTLSTKKPNPPIRLPWDIRLGMPVLVIINYNYSKGWSINYVLEQEFEQVFEQIQLDPEKTMSADLGVKRTATTFDGTTVKTYSGKQTMSLNRLENKIRGKTQKKIKKTKKKGRRRTKILRGQRKVVKRIKNQKKDILHKQSRQIADDAKSQGIKTIVFGDCGGIHTGTNLGKHNNQKVQQNPEQQLRKYVEEKHQRVGGATVVAPEDYTSRTCPCCGYVKAHAVNGRTFRCQKCGFIFDRDGVGSINIYQRNVSFDKFDKVSKMLDVVGGLAPPIGVKSQKLASRLSPVVWDNQTPRGV